MAPYVGPSREAVVEQIRQKKLPITLGQYGPQATITLASGVYALTHLELDAAAAAKAGREAIAKGESWMPEHEWQFLRPGKVLASANDLDAFVAQLQALTWRW